LWKQSVTVQLQVLGTHQIGDGNFLETLEALNASDVKLKSVKAYASLGVLKDIRDIQPDIITVGRFTDGVDDDVDEEGPNLHGDLQEEAERVMNSFMPKWEEHRDYVDYWEVTNEHDPNFPGGHARLAEFFIHCIDIANANGYKLAVLSYSLGVPEYWEMGEVAATGLLDICVAEGHALALHEYANPLHKWYGDPLPTRDGGQTLPNPNRGPLAFRYRFWEDFVDVMPTTFITEMNMNTDIRNVPVDVWEEQITWYIEEASKDLYVKGVHIFTWGSPGDSWPQFDISGATGRASFRKVAAATAKYPENIPTHPPTELPVAPYDKRYNVVEHWLTPTQITEVYDICRERLETVGPAPTDAVSWAVELLNAGKTVEMVMWYCPEERREDYIAWAAGIDERITVSFLPEVEQGVWDVDLHNVLPTNDGPYADPILKNGWYKRLPSEIENITIHHTASTTTWEIIAQNHINRDGGTPSIHYNLGVNSDGTIVRLTNFSTKKRHDAPWHDHTGYSNKNVGIALMGRLNEIRPTKQQVDAAVQLCKDIRKELGREIPVYGHDHYANTVCPGWMSGLSGYWKHEFMRKLNTVIGVHAAPVYHGPSNPDDMVSRMLSHKAKYCKILYQGTPSQLEFALKLKDAGITPVVRIWNNRHIGRNPNLHAARDMIDNGIDLIEVMNEPNIEWPNISWKNVSDVVMISDAFLADAKDVAQWGGRVAFPAMAPTDRGSVNQTVSGVEWAERMMAVTQYELHDVAQAGKLWLAVHVSPFNKPFDFNPQQQGYIDDFCFDYWKVAYERFKFYYQVDNPLIISTEGGVYSPYHMKQLTFPVNGDMVIGHDGFNLYDNSTWKKYTNLFYAYAQIPVCTWTFTDEDVGDTTWHGSGWYDKNGNLRLV
jgi:hypothetical protein